MCVPMHVCLYVLCVSYGCLMCVRCVSYVCPCMSMYTLVYMYTCGICTYIGKKVGGLVGG